MIRCLSQASAYLRNRVSPSFGSTNTRARLSYSTFSAKSSASRLSSPKDFSCCRPDRRPGARYRTTHACSQYLHLAWGQEQRFKTVATAQLPRARTIERLRFAVMVRKPPAVQATPRHRVHETSDDDR